MTSDNRELSWWRRANDEQRDTSDELKDGEEFQRGGEKFHKVQRAGPVADQPSRLRTPPGVGPRCRRLGSHVSATRKRDHLALVGRGETSKLGRSIGYCLARAKPSYRGLPI